MRLKGDLYCIRLWKGESSSVGWLYKNQNVACSNSRGHLAGLGDSRYKTPGDLQEWWMLRDAYWVSEAVPSTGDQIWPWEGNSI